MENREIKFRAWDDGKMIYQNQTIMLENNDQLWWFFKSIRKDAILMQYTGLKDKNGKEIYEGDIVTYDRGVGNWTGKRMITTHEIVFTDEVFAFVMKYGSSYIKLRKHWNYIYEIIGNIYENPELA